MAGTRGFIVYTMDDGTNVSLKASSNTASYNGQTVAKFPPVGSPWAYNHKDLRHLVGHNAGTGKASTMVVTDPAVYAAVVIGTDTFNNTEGTAFVVSSKIGERLDARDIG